LPLGILTFKMSKSVKKSKAEAQRVVHAKQKDFESRIDTIRAELVDKAPEEVERSLRELKASVEDMLDDVSRSIDYARENIDEVVQTSRATIQERPLMAVGVALAVGVAIGLILGRRPGVSSAANRARIYPR
jgi:ElaB/YqjD/DUF883 family membrane-anchored ribosome-binding protein